MNNADGNVAKDSFIPKRGENMQIMQIKFMILIALVFIITAGFCVLIWQQTKRFEKKALAAKQRQQEYEQVLRKQMHAEKRALKASQEAIQEEAESNDSVLKS